VADRRKGQEVTMSSASGHTGDENGAPTIGRILQPPTRTTDHVERGDDETDAASEDVCDEEDLTEAEWQYSDDLALEYAEEAVDPPSIEQSARIQRQECRVFRGWRAQQPAPTRFTRRQGPCRPRRPARKRVARPRAQRSRRVRRSSVGTSVGPEPPGSSGIGLNVSAPCSVGFARSKRARLDEAGRHCASSTNSPLRPSPRSRLSTSSSSCCPRWGERGCLNACAQAGAGLQLVLTQVAGRQSTVGLPVRLGGTDATRPLARASSAKCRSFIANKTRARTRKVSNA